MKKTKKRSFFEPRWMRNWRAGWRGLKLEAWNALAGLVLVTVLAAVVKLIEWIGG